MKNKDDNKDYSHMSLYDIVKFVLEDYSGLPVEQNMHIQTTMMWRMAELIENEEVELFDGTDIEYEASTDETRVELVRIGFFMVARFSTYLTFTGKAATDENEFKNAKGNVTKSNKENG